MEGSEYDELIFVDSDYRNIKCIRIVATVGDVCMHHYSLVLNKRPPACKFSEIPTPRTLFGPPVY